MTTRELGMDAARLVVTAEASERLAGQAHHSGAGGWTMTRIAQQPSDELFGTPLRIGAHSASDPSRRKAIAR